MSEDKWYARSLHDDTLVLENRDSLERIEVKMPDSEAQWYVYCNEVTIILRGLHTLHLTCKEKTWFNLKYTGVVR